MRRIDLGFMRDSFVATEGLPPTPNSLLFMEVMPWRRWSCGIDTRVESDLLAARPRSWVLEK
jgi:hypothetical protein